MNAKLTNLENRYANSNAEMGREVLRSSVMTLIISMKMGVQVSVKLSKTSIALEGALILRINAF